jgi:hypothetical protein
VRAGRPSSLSPRAFRVHNVPTSNHRSERLPRKNHTYAPLPPEFVSGHTCTHIALWYSERDEVARKDGMTHRDIFDHKERLSARAIIQLCLRSTPMTYWKVINKELHEI